MESILSQIADFMQSYPYIAPLLAFLGGVLVSFSPCSLSSIPLIVAYIAGTQRDNTRRNFCLSLTFALSSAVVLTGIGLAVSWAGMSISFGGQIWFLILGALMILMALQMLGIINIIPSTTLFSMYKTTGFLGAVLAGVLGALVSSPCASPPLIVLLALVASGKSLVWGALLLFCYSLGHGCLAVIAGSYSGFAARLKQNKVYSRSAQALSYLFGLAIMVLGLYLIYQGI